MFQRIIDHANRGDDPPSERILLRDSRVELREGHHRRAVLDAATAAEIALTSMLDDRLKELPQEVAELIRRPNRQLGPLVRTLQHLEIELPSSLQRDLAEVRNRVVHAGYQPSMAEARRTVELAGIIVEQSRPIERFFRA